jgi:NAD dependent epimerase/dehydratase family enzyme
MSTTQLSGAVNIVSPKPVSNREFTKVLGGVIHRPTIFPVPAFGIKMLFGEMGRTLLLEGVGVLPRKLLESGYKFRYDDLKLALTSVLKP